MPASAKRKPTPDEELADEIGEFIDDPMGFVMFAFPWTTDKSLQLVELQEPWATKYKSKFGPDRWACEFLDQIGKEVKARKFNGRKAVDPIRAAVSSGHGVGKSALTAWLVLWIMSTRPHAQGTVTANTSPQLETKTWAQVAKWAKICITSHWFDVSTGRGSMKMKSKESPDSWFCSAQTCREENSESFAGQHAANSTSFYIFDESSAVPDKIEEVAEGGLTDGEPMMFAFGNPTRNTGWFHSACFGRQKHRWITKRIDSRDVQITNKKQIQEWIDDYGLDSDFVKVRVRGIAPDASAQQLIPRALAEMASKRSLHVSQYDFAPVILGVDVAWVTGEDLSAIAGRQGLHSWIEGAWYHIDNMALGTRTSQTADEKKADAIFIDVGWGTGVIDYLRLIGKDPIPVFYGGSAISPRFKNKRTEMWWLMMEWLRDGGQIQDDPELIDELCGPEIYTLPNGQLMLESKDDMKTRDLPSPNKADALAETFASPVSKRREIDRYDTDRKPNMAKTETSFEELLN